MLRHARISAFALLAVSTFAACGGGGGGGSTSVPTPADMSVEARAGGRVDLTGTTWSRCEPGWPYAGQSYWHSWSFGRGTATIRHEVYTASTDCTGATDPAEHFEVAMTFAATGGDRTVGWPGTAPAGYPSTLTATGVTFSAPAYSLTARGVAWVDDTQQPARLFVTNPGDSPAPPADADGHPTVVSTLEHAKM